MPEEKTPVMPSELVGPNTCCRYRKDTRNILDEYVLGILESAEIAERIYDMEPGMGIRYVIKQAMQSQEDCNAISHVHDILYYADKAMEYQEKLEREEERRRQEERRMEAMERSRAAEKEREAAKERERRERERIERIKESPLFRDLTRCGIGNPIPICKALSDMGVRTFEQAASLSDEQILGIRGVGVTILEKIRRGQRWAETDATGESR